MRDIQLHGIGVGKKLEGTAQAGDVLSGETFSNADEIGLTGIIPRKGAQTYTPGTSNQIISAGQYLNEIQTILGDPDLISSNIKAGTTIFGVSGNSNVVDTSGGDAVASQILNGKKAYVDGVLVTGDIPSKGAATITPGTSNQTISAGQYLSGVQTIAGDSDLIPSNIKTGVNIFGVTGAIPIVKSINFYEFDASSDTQAITPVDPDNSIIIPSFETGSSDSSGYIDFVNSSSVKAYTTAGTLKRDNRWPSTNFVVIEFHPGVIKSKQVVTVSTGSSTYETFWRNIGINSVDPSKTAVISLGHSENPYTKPAGSGYITTSTNAKLVATRETGSVKSQIIEFY